MKTITDVISYLPAGVNPLSADVIMVEGKDRTYFFDVGSNDGAYDLVKNKNGKKTIILSHFHQDHTENLKRLLTEEYDIYVGKESYKHFKVGQIVEGEARIIDGVDIDICCLPSSHCKGSLCMCVDNEYLFLGDGIYSGIFSGKRGYNVQFLKEEIDFLEKKRFEYALISHDLQFVYSKKDIMDRLKEIYCKREKGNPYIMQ